jgi:uncharacterized protein YjdB
MRRGRYSLHGSGGQSISIIGDFIAIVAVSHDVAVHTATAFVPANSIRDLTDTASWSSSSSGTTSVSSSSAVRGVSAGSVNISASLDSLSASAVVTVNPKTLVSLVVNAGSNVVPIGAAV